MLPCSKSYVVHLKKNRKGSNLIKDTFYIISFFFQKLIILLKTLGRRSIMAVFSVWPLILNYEATCSKMFSSAVGS